MILMNTPTAKKDADIAARQERARDEMPEDDYAALLTLAAHESSDEDLTKDAWGLY